MRERIQTYRERKNRERDTQRDTQRKNKERGREGGKITQNREMRKK